MKRKGLYIFLGAEVALLCMLYILADFVPTVVSSVMSVPFEQIGLALRSLSLCGKAANGLAVALWAGICLLPLFPVLQNWQDKEKCAEHIFLIVLSVMLFVVLYYMINPGFMYKLLPESIRSMVSAGDQEILSVMKAVLSMAVWSVAVGYVVFRLLRMFRAGDKEQLYLYLHRLLYALCAMFAGAMVMTCGEMLKGLQEAQGAVDGALTVLKSLVAALPYVMDVMIIFLALNLLDELLADSHSEKVAAAAGKLSGVCCAALAVVTASGVMINILQLVLFKYLSDINIQTDIPFLSLAFVLAALLFSRLIDENKQLAEENEMFI